MGHALVPCSAFAPPDPLWNLPYPSKGSINTARLPCSLAPRWNWPMGSPASTEKAEERRGHRVYYLTSSPLSHFSTKQMLHLQTQLPLSPSPGKYPKGLTVFVHLRPRSQSKVLLIFCRISFNPALNFAKGSLVKSLQLLCLNVLHKHIISGP